MLDLISFYCDLIFKKRDILFILSELFIQASVFSVEVLNLEGLFVKGRWKLIGLSFQLLLVEFYFSLFLLDNLSWLLLEILELLIKLFDLDILLINFLLVFFILLDLKFQILNLIVPFNI